MTSLFRSLGTQIGLIVFILAWVMPVTITAQAAQLPGTGQSQEKPSDEKEVPAKDPLGRSTPQGTVIGFMREAGREDYERAAQYLDSVLPAKSAERLAVQLYTVLNYGLSNDVSEVSAEAEGDLAENLDRGREKIGSIETPTRTYPIILERVERDKMQVWLFSSQTLKAVPEMYKGIKPRAIEKYIPETFKTYKILKYPLWKWIMFIMIVPLSFLFSWFLTWLIFIIARNVFRLTDASFSLKGPVRVLGLAAAFYIASIMSYSLLSRLFWIRVSETLLIIGLTWLCLKLIDPAVKRIWGHREITSSGTIAVTRLLHKTVKTVIVIIGLLFIFYLGGINVTAVLTGLGIGGIAIAFAAQKTLENFFGGIMIVWDQPIRVGDFCRGENHMGTVEDIGLRSTKLRTPQRTVVSIPNGQLATMSLENFSVRDKILFHHKLPLRLETSVKQLKSIAAHIGRILSTHPNLEKESAWVRFTGLKDSGLEIETWAYILSTDYDLFQAIQEELLLHFMTIIEDAGTSLSIPSRMAYITQALKVRNQELHDTQGPGK
ncbi:MAG: mechanosensitive ion channel family protein [Syntrophorhabdaceae bacterium]